MFHKQLISYEDKYDIIEREKRSSTEISNLVAFPHCISSSNNNIIAVCIMDKPIKYGSTEVKIIFLAVLRHKNENNKNVFLLIKSKTKKIDKVNKLCEAKSLNEFIDILIEVKSND